MRTQFVLAVILFSCFSQASGSGISPSLTPLNSSYDCQSCLFSEAAVPFKFKCNLAKDSHETVAEVYIGSNIRQGGFKESDGVYGFRTYTIREDDHLLKVRCVATDMAQDPFISEETSATLYVVKQPKLVTLKISKASITCVAKGGRPAPTLVMKSNGIILSTSQSNLTDSPRKTNSTYTTNALVENPLLLSEGQTISCCTVPSFTEMKCAEEKKLDFEPNQGNEEVTETTTKSATTVRSEPATVSFVTQASKVIVSSEAVSTDEEKHSNDESASASSCGHILTVGWLMSFGVALGTI
ncbi:uncharacterized protein LOC128236019 [Mya arenaria]|uniref:uncharacterized protein LOC128236019 n=1 Tax=Mya arenaria TaxID=6604 RepID=UPI0022E6B31F|nr:uncharacterized protein LOC128236019 [Mya arenaria]